MNRNELATEILRDCPSEALADHEAIAAALRRGDSPSSILTMDQLDRWPETYSWIKAELVA